MTFFVAAIERWTQTAGGDPATIMGVRHRSWAQSADRVARIASVLHGLGARQGATVGILAGNSDRYLEVIHAAWWIGAVPVPLNVRWAPVELADAINDSEIEILVADESLAAATALRERCPRLTHVISLFATAADALDLETLIAAAAPIAPQPAAADAPAGIFYTGGATGRSKGVVHSTRSLWAAASIGATGMRVPDRPTYLHAAPMFHLGGLMPAFMTTALGGTHVFVEAFRPALVAAAVRATQVSFTALVPVMIAMLVRDDGFDIGDYASLELVQYGGGAIGSALREKLSLVLPRVRFEQGYGQSEVGGGISTMPHELTISLGAADHRRGSAGRAHDGVEIVVTNPDGQLVPPGVVGEFRIRSPGAMTGYLKRPDETAAALVDGWVRTGDAGYLDSGGFIFVCDRLKDVVRPGGENVFSAEVENAVLCHPAIKEAAVIAVPDDRWEERVHAVVTVRAGATLTLDELQAHCRDRIAGYKIPRSLEIVAAMPLSGAGKIMKSALREPHWHGQGRMQRA
jgi:acyl-CoA synthetase (AMP-forming)/AMP-acid ligase II